MGTHHRGAGYRPGRPKPGVDYPVCLAGKLACPPEDCGGIYRYEHMLTVVADADHEEHDDLVEWLGDDFDPEAFDIDEVNDMLAEWREG
ncbi:plasmid pRiA4b ORF-3 family protein [Mucisphaera calidilacus]|nr:plasmid pRiA4b ORF-3 family protein [Mucisphaera calidilacus]